MSENRELSRAETARLRRAKAKFTARDQGC